MPSWWGKSSSKETKKKPGKESFMDTLHRKFKIPSEGKSNRCGGSKRHCSDAISELGSHSRAISRSPSPSKHVARCQSFAERPNAQPLPLPSRHHPASIINRTDSGISISLKPRSEKVSKPSSFLPLPRPACIRGRLNRRDLDGDLVTASVSSESSLDSDDPTTDSRSRSPHATDYENGTRTAASSPPSAKLKEKSSPAAQISLREAQKPVNLFFTNPVSSPTSPKRRPLRNHVLNLQIPYHGSAPDSSMSSPSRSPMRAYNSEQAMNSAFWAGKAYPDTNVLGSGHCSSPGSGQNSGHNSMGGDMAGQLFWQHSRGSPEYSPIPSPRMASPGPSSRMASPGPSSRIQSGAVTPIHPRCSGPSTETQTEMGKKKSHRLPLPPVTIPSSSPFSYPNSAATSPTMPRSPGRADNPTSPGPRWKKGKLLGRGTFGHVYVAFNNESGEMCAMKEVTLFADDAKSKESAKQLGQEIALLSRLRHPNIVQYYGSETLDDRLYIYLEYVSGGSIHKLLQDYGQFGELAIRSYTQQILSGLAFLHAKSTVHRDIKGANILVDPNGRVKLADFGMAKHISGQSCPLSFKGSPYWMAPEVIKNSSGSNLAVDIWSLGCTVLEMATSKPPWSQYEGIAAMFKIGNSKDLPVIPDHLSDEGKDFVKLCLQRNPKNRPTASQLLEHSFVKNAPSLGFTNGIKTLGSDYTREPSSMDTERLAIHSSRVSRATSPLSSDSFIPRNISCPVSPIGSPILQSRSPQHLSGRLSPSPISSPRTISGSSTPLTGGNGAIPIHHSKHSISLQEGFSGMPKSANNLYVNGNSYYNPNPNPNPNIFGGMQPGSHVFPELGSGAGSGSAHGGQSVLADRVCRLLLGDHMKMNPSLDLSPNSPLQSRNNGN